MSRIGKRPIAIPEKTEVTITDNAIRVKGPLGELSRALRPEIEVLVKDNTIVVRPKEETNFARALWGTFTSHIKNMVRGVNEPYVKKLIIEGVGYRAAVSGDNLELNVGFSHSVSVPLPKELSVKVEKNEITVSGSDKELVGQFTAKVRAVKKPEPYKGKGIRYHDEVVRRKQGKRAVV